MEDFMQYRIYQDHKRCPRCGDYLDPLQACDCLEFKTGQRVVYVPLHAQGDAKHNDCETGTISSLGRNIAFVRFDRQVKELGWEESTSQACDFCNLVLLRDIQK